MKNFMPNLSKKSSTCLTLARWPHQHRSAVTPGGKLAAFAFTGLNSWSEHGTLMIAKGEPTKQKERDRSTCAAKSVDPCFHREKSESVAGKYGGTAVAGKYDGNAKGGRGGGKIWRERGDLFMYKTDIMTFFSYVSDLFISYVPTGSSSLFSLTIV